MISAYLAKRLFLTLFVILCCWVAGAANRAGLFFPSWNWKSGLPVLLVLACAFVSLARIYSTDRGSTIICTVLSIIVITLLDHFLRNSDLYKVAIFYLWPLVAVTVLALSLSMLLKVKGVQHGLALMIYWLLLTLVIIWVGVDHVNHRANAMIGIDYLVVVASSLVVAEAFYQYRRYRSRCVLWPPAEL